MMRKSLLTLKRANFLLLKTWHLLYTYQACFILITALFFNITSASWAQTTPPSYTWIGGVSGNFADPNNWSPNTFNPNAALTGSEIITIGSGSPNNPIQAGGSSATNRRVGKLNTITGSQFTVSGVLYPNSSDNLNGNVAVIGNADFNIRNNVIIGNGAPGVVTLTGGTLSSKNVLFVGRNAGGNGILNIWGGKVNAGTDLQVGANGATGAINFKSVGTLTVPGNKVAFLQGLLSSGVITVDGGRELDIVYNSTTNFTQASIKQDPNSLLKEYADNVVIENGIISLTIRKSNAQILSYKYKGFEMLTDGYYSMDGGSNYAQPSNCQFTIKALTNDFVDVSFKSIWTGQRAQAFDIDVHFALERTGTGAYTYALLSHPGTYPATGVGEWRMVWKLNQDQVENLYVDDARHMQMPNAADIAAAQPTGIAEAIKITSGVKSGQYECKYNYSVEYEKVGTYGHASNVNKIGSWLVFGGFDYFNDGPTKQDLSAALGIIHVHFGRNHYNGSSTSVAAGEQWSKVYGPFMLYVNSNEAGADACWTDAKAKAVEESSKWPYAWLTNTPEYPSANERGSVSGKFIVSDSFKPAITGGKAMVGLAQPDPGGNWQSESKRYQYWVRTNDDGTFAIPHIRPGAYTLYAFIDGEVGEYAQANIIVNAGESTSVGDVVWEIPRNKGKLLWEIGVPDRTAKEFKHGDDYFVPFLWEKYSDELPNPIVYTVGQSDWSTDWNYAHSGHLTNDTTMVAWPWKVNFTINDLPDTGNATLTLAFAGSDHARLDTYVNDSINVFNRLYPEQGGGNALVRQGVHAKYSVTTLQIPVSKLRLGQNTITLVQGRATSRADHLMYDYVSLEVPSNHIPVASFEATPISGYSPLNVSFNASASHDDDGAALTYAWNFGDGATASQSTAVHTYTSPGNYIATLIVKDTRGATDTTASIINVLNNPPVANFVATPTAGYAPLVVSFDASTTTDMDSDSLTYNWNFGDGATGIGKLTEHTYYAPSQYIATLMVTDTRGDASSSTVAISAVSGLKVQYRVRSNEINPTDNHIKPHFKIVNNGTQSVPYNELTLRYWYTSEGYVNQNFWCDYAALGTNNVKGSFGIFDTPHTTADHYVEIRFTTTASIAPGGNSGEIQTRFNKVNWSNYAEANDYSYDQSKTNYTDWSQVTLYRNGKLFWGVEPPNAESALPAGANSTLGNLVSFLGTGGLTLYPNPLQGNVVRLNATLSSPSNNVQVYVYNLVGHAVRYENLGSQESTTLYHTMDLTGLPKGVYVVKLLNGNSVKAATLIVN